DLSTTRSLRRRQTRKLARRNRTFDDRKFSPGGSRLPRPLDFHLIGVPSLGAYLRTDDLAVSPERVEKTVDIPFHFAFESHDPFILIGRFRKSLNHLVQ